MTSSLGVEFSRYIHDPYEQAKAEYARSRQEVETMEQALGRSTEQMSDQVKLSVQREAEYNAKRLMQEQERRTAEALAKRAEKKVAWAEMWMIYSIVFILASALALFIVMHGLAVN